MGKISKHFGNFFGRNANGTARTGNRLNGFKKR